MFPCEVGIISFNFCHFFVCRETSSPFDDILRLFFDKSSLLLSEEH